MDETNNLDLTCGMTDEEMTERFKIAVKRADEEKKIKGFPVQKFDFEKKKPYIEFPSGEREYV